MPLKQLPNEAYNILTSMAAIELSARKINAA
jgi:hypothetical protein